MTRAYCAGSCAQETPHVSKRHHSGEEMLFCTVCDAPRPFPPRESSERKPSRIRQLLDDNPRGSWHVVTPYTSYLKPDFRSAWKDATYFAEIDSPGKTVKVFEPSGAYGKPLYYRYRHGARRKKNPAPLSYGAKYIRDHGRAAALKRLEHLTDQFQTALTNRDLRQAENLIDESENLRRALDGVGRNPVPPSSAAGSRASVASRSRQVKAAASLYHRFSGHKPEIIGKVAKPKIPDVMLAIGDIDGIMYSTIRDGRLERYVHEFKQSSRPLFAVSHDGKQLYMLGGAYDFTERGIVDRRRRK